MGHVFNRLAFILVLTALLPLCLLANTAKAVGDRQCSISATDVCNLKGFVSDKKHDLSGKYVPKKEVRFGKYVLTLIDIEQLPEFKKFEAGEKTAAPWPPINFFVQDPTSKRRPCEIEPCFVNEPMVKPLAYELSGDTIRFVGTNRQLGEVVFSGTFYRGRIRAAQAVRVSGGDSGGKSVLKGDLSVGGKTIKNLLFIWWAGD